MRINASASTYSHHRDYYYDYHRYYYFFQTTPQTYRRAFETSENSPCDFSRRLSTKRSREGATRRSVVQSLPPRTLNSPKHFLRPTTNSSRTLKTITQTRTETPGPTRTRSRSRAKASALERSNTSPRSRFSPSSDDDDDDDRNDRHQTRRYYNASYFSPQSSLSTRLGRARWLENSSSSQNYYYYYYSSHSSSSSRPGVNFSRVV